MRWTIVFDGAIRIDQSKTHSGYAKDQYALYDNGYIVVSSEKDSEGYGVGGVATVDLYTDVVTVYVYPYDNYSATLKFNGTPISNGSSVTLSGNDTISADFTYVEPVVEQPTYV